MRVPADEILYTSRTSAVPVSTSIYCERIPRITGLNLLNGIINNIVAADLHAVSVCVLLGHRVYAGVERYDNGIGGSGQHHIALADGAHGAVDHMNPHLVVFNLQQGLLYSLDGALNIGLDNHIKGLQLAGLQGVKQGVQRHLMEGAEFFFLGSFVTLLHQLAGQPLVGHGVLIRRRCIGALSRPMISTGTLGPAEFTLRPR